MLQSREIQKKEQTARKDLENFRARRNAFERDQRIAVETREFDNNEHAARKELGNFRTKSKPLEREQGISKETREVEIRSNSL